MAVGPHVGVIGGGVTGTGIARDLSMRGFEVTVFEQGSLAAGATGHMHGLLHSGARYAVSDAETARACRRENVILRRIASQCIEPTGGLFVTRPEDSVEYYQEKVAACKACDIPVEEVSGRDARQMEPDLADNIDRGFTVPDATIDPFKLTLANAVGARDHGASIRTQTAITDILIEDGAVQALEVAPNAGRSGCEEVDVEHVVNATGAWADRVGAMAGIHIPMRPTKGAMVVLEGRLVDSVINRCRPTTEGDIVVPYGESIILGTTNTPIQDPDDFPQETEEVQFLLEELSEVLPTITSRPRRQSYWGVRPLYDPSEDEGRGDPTLPRTHFLLDHRARDGLTGFTTIVGGKLTTYRAMAEDVADLLCAQHGVEAKSETANRALPGHSADDDFEQYFSEFDISSSLASPD